ncbi:MAG: hypothetical protein KH310_14575 [Enterobacteriaceae bacterium]|nr:hypothetical protein [Enterobacteriaceae bacterium]
MKKLNSGLLKNDWPETPDKTPGYPSPFLALYSLQFPAQAMTGRYIQLWRWHVSLHEDGNTDVLRSFCHVLLGSQEA